MFNLQDNYDIKIVRMECEFNVKFCSQKICKTRSLGKDQNQVEFSCTLRRDTNTVRLRLVNYMKITDYRQQFVDTSEDYCAYLEGLQQPTPKVVFAHSFLNHTNWSNKCPFKVD